MENPRTPVVGALPVSMPAGSLRRGWRYFWRCDLVGNTTRKQQIEAMLAEDPHDPFLRYGLAMEYVSEGDDIGAVRCFRDLIATSADYVPAHLQLGQALHRLGKTAEARVA